MEFLIRQYYTADPGSILVFQDANSEEYTLMGHYGDDENYKQAIRDGKDVHKNTYATCFNVPYEEVTDEQRGKGKTTGFGLLYGLGNPAFAKALGYDIDEVRVRNGTKRLYEVFKPWKIPPYDTTTYTEAEIIAVATNDGEKDGIIYFLSESMQTAIKAAVDMKKIYFSQFPGIKQFLKDCAKAGEDRGYVKTWTGRRRHFKDPKKEGYKAPNAVIQGGCGDIIKVKMHEVSKFLEPHKTRMINNVHDELTTRHPIVREELALIDSINKILCDLPFRVPITWGIEWGYDWGHKRPYTGFEDLCRELGV